MNNLHKPFTISLHRLDWQSESQRLDLANKYHVDGVYLYTYNKKGYTNDVIEGLDKYWCVLLTDIEFWTSDFFVGKGYLMCEDSFYFMDDILPQELESGMGDIGHVFRSYQFVSEIEPIAHARS